MAQAKIDVKKLGIKIITPDMAAVITPAIAAAILEYNTNNRPRRQDTTNEYTRRMNAGEWELNGDAIRLSGDRLLDGQNRLHACVASGKSFETFVVVDLPSAVFRSIDDGKKRSDSDVLRIDGEKHGSLIASSLRLVDKYLTGRVMGNVNHSKTQIKALLSEHPDIRISTATCYETKGIIPPSTLTAAHYLFAKLDLEAADQFVKDLVQGTGLMSGDGVYLLREALMKNSLSKAKLGKGYIFALTVKAWNARREGKVVSNLRMREKGDNPESFPIIR